MNRLPIRAPAVDERAELERWARSGKSAWYQRARTVLLAAEARLGGTEIARALGLHPNTTRCWLHAFQRGGLLALAPKPKGGKARTCGDDVAEALIALLHEPPEAHGTEAGRWMLRNVAALLVRGGRAAAAQAAEVLPAAGQGVAPEP